MKFRTIVITKRKLTVFAAAAAACCAVIGAAAYFSARGGEIVPAFKEDKPPYEEILDEGLSNGENKFDLKKIISSLLGFNPTEPETIVKEFSPALDDAPASDGFIDNPEEPLPDEKTEEPAKELESENQEKDENPADPALPSSEQIRASVGLSVNNASSYSVDVDGMCADNLTFSNTPGEPLVLIMHTHTTECYDGDQMSGETERTTDDTKNVVEIGNVIQGVLEENGISCVHDATYHDYPSYQGAYTRALSTIQNNLDQYPSIKIVLDVHRDAFIYEDGTKLKVDRKGCDIPASQVMLVAGTDSMGLSHDNWRENLKFAAKIQNAAEIMYPGLMRPINLRTERFNMHMTPGSLIMEVGSNGNTLAEAKEGAREAARAVAAAILAG